MFYNRFKNGAAPILTQPLFCLNNGSNGSNAIALIILIILIMLSHNKSGDILRGDVAVYLFCRCGGAYGV